MGPQLCSCGNGDMMYAGMRRMLASMGPQLCSCGNPACWQCIRSAATLLQWGRNFAVAETRAVHGLSLRRPALQWGRNFAVAETLEQFGSSQSRCGLQWGRNFAVAETRSMPTSHAIRAEASMGPQLCSCGNRQNHHVRFVRHQIASMGPQLCSCGNMRQKKWELWGWMLQWGRNFAVAETARMHVETTDSLVASMGPQLCSCGNPRPTGTNPSFKTGFNGAATLQLRKPALDRTDAVGESVLQWGRNFAVAETDKPLIE